jgi:transcriptional regulator with XRE-family HTH domain
MSKPTPSNDRLIGARVRECRMTLGLNQHQFGELVGVTNQQVHKYEHGIDRVSASRLYEIACGSGTPVEYFFADLEPNATQLPVRQRRLLDVMSAIGDIRNEKHQAVIGQLVRSLAGH